MITLQNISYSHPNKDLLFTGIHLTVTDLEKTALIGNNGTGKSTLLKIIAGDIPPTFGHRSVGAQPYFIPQIIAQFDHLTIAQALKVEHKLRALKEILKGNVTEENYSLLGDHWTIEEECSEALGYWDLADLDLSQKMETLSGGQKTRVFLAGISLHQPELVLLDEPSNHLDMAGRQLLYDFVRSTKSTLLVVGHDRNLLNLVDTVCELTNQEIKVYGGNYDFYKQQKQIENDAFIHKIQSKEKAYRKAREKEREILERKQKLDSRGKGRQEKAGVARIMMNTLRNNAEKSTSKLKNTHAQKTDDISQELLELRAALPDIDKMRFGFSNSDLHKGKILFTLKNINFAYDNQQLWKEDLNFQITSGERIAFTGVNGSGKTTLLKMILGQMKPQTGIIYRADCKSVYIDQHYSLIDETVNVYEHAQLFNNSALQEHEIKNQLNRFLFFKEDWSKSCAALSGGERMRLLLCCLTIDGRSPDIIILDEPTNNLDIQNVEILIAAINEYAGSLIVVSHDDHVLKQLQIARTIDL